MCIRDRDKPVRKTKSNKVSPSTPELAEEELAAKFATMNQEDYRDLAESPRRRAREAALLLSFQMDMGVESWNLAAMVDVYKRQVFNLYD